MRTVTEKRYQEVIIQLGDCWQYYRHMKSATWAITCLVLPLLSDDVLADWFGRLRPFYGHCFPPLDRTARPLPRLVTNLISILGGYFKRNYFKSQKLPFHSTFKQFKWLKLLPRPWYAQVIADFATLS